MRRLTLPMAVILRKSPATMTSARNREPTIVGEARERLLGRHHPEQNQ
jgi:hypothetical protein